MESDIGMAVAMIENIEGLIGEVQADADLLYRIRAAYGKGDIVQALRSATLTEVSDIARGHLCGVLEMKLDQDNLQEVKVILGSWWNGESFQYDSGRASYFSDSRYRASASWSTVNQVAAGSGKPHVGRDKGAGNRSNGESGTKPSDADMPPDEDMRKAQVLRDGLIKIAVSGGMDERSAREFIKKAVDSAMSAKA
ncbi:hypothetical protein [Streptomyces sp. NPDC086023]|uniref:hypothetical protein n=1 Tax=Streptomyces sp. NPDC086023 TaxID=3365746 RepID=UPI0037D02184